MDHVLCLSEADRMGSHQGNHQVNRWIAALLLINLCLCVVHVFLIVTTPINDFDTQEAIRVMVFKDRIAGIQGDTAHPLFSCLLWKVLCGISFYWVKCCWSLAVGSALFLGITALWFGGKIVRFSPLACQLAIFIYLASSTTNDISARGEENFYYHALYILCVMVFMRISEKDASRRTLILASCLNTVMAAVHLQPFMILAGSQGLFLTLACLCGLRARKREGRRPLDVIAPYLLQAGLCCLLPSILLLVYMKIFKISQVPYQNIYLSLIHQHDWYYPGVFLSSMYGYMESLRPSGIRYISSIVICQDYGAIAGGLFLFLVVLAYLLRNFKRNAYLASLGITALVFVLVYEPTSSERWDTFVICLILLLAANVTRYRLQILDIMVLALLTFQIPFVVGFDCQSIQDRMKDFKSVKTFMHGERTIHVIRKDCSADAVRKLIFDLPPLVRIVPDDVFTPARGYIYFLPDKANVDRLKAMKILERENAQVGLYKIAGGSAGS